MPKPSRIARKILKVWAQGIQRTIASAEIDAKHYRSEVGPKRVLTPWEMASGWPAFTREGRISSRFKLATESGKQFVSKTKSRTREFYRTEFKRNQKRIPVQLVGRNAKSIAREKLLRIVKEAQVHETMGEFYQKDGSTKKMKVKYRVIPCRYTNLSRVLSELSKKEMFVGAEALVGFSPFDKTQRQRGIINPEQDYRSHVNRAHSDTNWQGIMDCRVIFDPAAFKEGTHWKIPGWGSIESIGRSNVLGIQLFEPNPKKLAEFAKTMAKRRPNDPIVIFDLYGNVFYP